jgi:hypothetical protein
MPSATATRDRPSPRNRLPPVNLCSAVVGDVPTMPSISPRRPAVRPLATLPRDRTAASDTPRMVSMNSSGAPKDSTSGRASGIARVRPTAPRMPPAMEDRNARLNALAACPFLAMA